MRGTRVATLALVVAGAAASGWWMARSPVAPKHDVCATTARGDGPRPGMVWVPGGSFTMGSDRGFPEEGPASETTVGGFFIDQTEVTNAQFAEFVAATGYRTVAERATPAGSAVFRPRAGSLRTQADWWLFEEGADWRHPAGPGSTLRGRERHPVVHVALADAAAYARWKGHRLPTEAEFEYAARGSARRDADGRHIANTWQGEFPVRDMAADSHAGIAPAGCYAPNPQGVYDLLGNVWEWTATPYHPRHDLADAAHPAGFDPAQPDEPAVAVVKGGSYLCSPDYCMRYRPEARIGQAPGLPTAHIGFRTVLDP